MATAEEIKARAREIMAQDLPEYYNPEVRDDEQLLAEGGIDSLGFIQVLFCFGKFSFVFFVLL